MAFLGHTVHQTLNTLTKGLTELGRSDVIENSVIYRLVGAGGVKVKNSKGEVNTKYLL